MRVVSLGLVCVAAWAQCGLLSWDDYRAVRHSFPYVVRSEGLVLFGTQHTRDPKHPDLAEIERLWREFHPEIAFSEGGVRPPAPSRDEAVARYGEAGLLRWLADHDHVTIRSLEPERPVVEAALIAEFGAEHVKQCYDRRDTVDPTRHDGVLNEIGRRDTDMRYCHMAPLIGNAVRSGKRVSVLVGGTHAVIWSLRCPRYAALRTVAGGWNRSQ